VHRSLKHLYAQLVDDTTGSVLATVSTRSADARNRGASRCNIASARVVGEMMAEKAMELGKKTIVFDRSGYRYHGRVKALAEAAREKGLKF
jgi:large subunit ribosomal protein L18